MFWGMDRLEYIRSFGIDLEGSLSQRLRDRPVKFVAVHKTVGFGQGARFRCKQKGCSMSVYIRAAEKQVIVEIWLVPIDLGPVAQVPLEPRAL
jgi:hypothetical protein